MISDFMLLFPSSSRSLSTFLSLRVADGRAPARYAVPSVGAPPSRLRRVTTRGTE